MKKSLYYLICLAMIIAIGAGCSSHNTGTALAGTGSASADSASADSASADNASADSASADNASADNASADSASADNASADNASADNASADSAGNTLASDGTGSGTETSGASMTAGDGTPDGDTTGEAAASGDTTGEAAAGGDTTGEAATGGDTTGEAATGGDTTGEAAAGGDTTGEAATNGATMGWEPSAYKTVNNFDGVSMAAKECTTLSTGLTLVFTNKSESKCIYGEYFTLEKKIGGSWYQVPVAIDGEYGFNSIGYNLEPDGESEWISDWEWLYGSLEPGEYRIVKDILDFRGTGDYDTYYLAAEFIVAH